MQPILNFSQNTEQYSWYTIWEKYIIPYSTHPLSQFIWIHLLWTSIHILCANAYVYYCAYPTIFGLITSMFTTHSPHCSLLRYGIDVGVHATYSFWATVSIWVTGIIIQYYPKTD